MPLNLNQKIKFWHILLLFAVILILVFLFKSSFAGLFLLFSPLIFFLLFSVKSLTAPKNTPRKDLSMLKKVLSVLGILAIQLFIAVFEFASLFTPGGSQTDSNFILTVSIIFPVIIWIVYYAIKQTIPIALIIITGIPPILVFLLHSIR